MEVHRKLETQEEKFQHNRVWTEADRLGVFSHTRRACLGVDPGNLVGLTCIPFRRSSTGRARHRPATADHLWQTVLCGQLASYCTPRVFIR